MSWTNIRAVERQGFISEPLLFLIYIMIYQMILKVNEIFLLMTRLFSVVCDTDNLANDFNHDLEKICEWAFQ